MSHEGGTRSGRDRLIYMANQIARFFAAMPRDEAVDGVARHINDFWEPRMRRQFFDLVEAGGEGLDPLVLQAAATVRRPPAETPPPSARAQSL